MRTDTNGAGETFWTISTPPEFGSVEVSLIATKRGLMFGDDIIPWATIDKARTDALYGTALLTIAQMKEQGARCGCLGHNDYCPCQNVPDPAMQTPRERG